MKFDKEIEAALRSWSNKSNAAISIMIMPHESLISVCIINADGSMSFAQTESFSELYQEIDKISFQKPAPRTKRKPHRKEKGEVMN